jgi:fibronectin type 3 domain-containing protein
MVGKFFTFRLSSTGALAAVMSLSLLIGCAGISSGSSASNQASSSQTSTNSLDQLSVSPSTLSFGNVTVGSSSSLTGTLTAGASDVIISSAGWNGEGYSVTGITFPVTVAAGATANYTVTFVPSVAGVSSGSISFVSNASNSPLAQPLTGTGTQSGTHSVALSWNASASNVIGYNVYRGTKSGGPYIKLVSSPQPGTAFADATVASGSTYYYVTTSVDSEGAESIYSNQAQAVIPSP